MHILFTIRSLSCGGAERVTVNLSNKWIEKGYQVTILTLASKEDDFYELDSKINRIDLNLGSYSKPYQQLLCIKLSQLARKIKPVLIGMICLAFNIMEVLGLKSYLANEYQSNNRLWSQLRKILSGNSTAQTVAKGLWRPK